MNAREAFRNAVFARDDNTCVVPGCGNPAQDAHHILERRLFTDGGYDINNGASVCGDCHLDAEMTLLDVNDLREWCGITKPYLPEHLYSDVNYDKWGNIVQINGTRLKGDLFYDESVQKILAKGQVLDLFTHYVKYPRTYHLPFSPGITDDDRAHKNLDHFENVEVVITMKMDGENCNLYQDHIHARSIDSSNHPSRARAKAYHAQIQGDIPIGWRICAENLYAEHSIHYNDLEAYLLAFSIWDDKNVCLSWDDTQEWFELFEFPQVPILYEGIYSEKTLKDIIAGLDLEKNEGVVMRKRDAIPYHKFRKWVGKYVRANHVVHHAGHWSNRRIIPNELK